MPLQLSWALECFPKVSVTKLLAMEIERFLLNQIWLMLEFCFIGFAKWETEYG